jgi:peptidoglycan/xylan/chitin deacetylase (PgdA/CDA1 family)
MSLTQTIKIPILTYHSINESGSVISTGSKVFRSQMKFLRDADFNVVSLKTLGIHLRANIDLPPRTVVLTFDDGFKDFYTTAFPILDEYGLTATVFLITDYCGKFNDWAGNLPGLERERLMDWNEIKELADNKIEFGAHSLTHPDLTRISGEMVRREIAGSKTAIEQRLGKEASEFAYPYGSFNQSVKRMTQECFTLACATDLGKVQPPDDVYALKRIDAYYLSNGRVFRALLSESFDWYMNFRQAMRSLKAACYSK